MQSLHHIWRYGLYALTLSTLFAACDNDATGLGADIMPGQDNVYTSTATFRLDSRSVSTGAVIANTSTCYLGTLIDPETRAQTKCDFLAQFNLLENYTLPDRSLMVKDETGKVKIDSCYIALLYSTFYGDSLSTMRIRAEELSTTNIMQENVSYYTNSDFSVYRAASPRFVQATSFAARDLTKNDYVLDNGNAYRAVNIVFPASLGQHLIETYYQHPEYYKNAYTFIHNVCPGFYFGCDGVGTMLRIESAVLDVNFSYHSKTAAGNDTIVAGSQRVAATQEVLQNTSVNHALPEEMLRDNQAYTYVKSPAGIHTETTLPVDDIIAGEHRNDTINAARIMLRRYNLTDKSDLRLEPPTHLLMVRKGDVNRFFEKPNVADNITSFYTAYAAANNGYTFDNIASLITYMKLERDKGAGVMHDDADAVRQEKYAKWEAEHPDWNKVAILPVTLETQTNTTYYGTTTSVLRINPEYGMRSVKLVGGDGGHIELSVIYSRFTN